MNNTGNSLSDLLKRTDNIILGDKNVSKEDIQEINNNISLLQAKKATLSNPKKIEEIDLRIAELESSKNLGDGGMKSLFDETAYIDYARFINTDGYVHQEWKHYNQESENNFGLNSPIDSMNVPVPYMDSTLNPIEGLDIPNLVEWSQRYPALKLRLQDFVYCKNMDYYANNRLVVLRRFRGGVPDNLFDYSASNNINEKFFTPVSTMITWVDPEEESLFNFSFSEGWEPVKNGIMETFENTLTGKESSDNSSLLQTFQDTALSLLGDKVLPEGLQREDGVKYYERSAAGNPNLIKSAQRRTHGGGSLESTINMKLRFEYQMRYIKGIDPTIAMMDLISNTLRMGTSTSEFRYAVPAIKDSQALQYALNGSLSDAVDTFKTELEGFKKSITEKFQESISSISVSDFSSTLQDLGDNSLTFLMSRFRETLKGAISADTGMASGIWHVTIGNPKAPTISCGDMILTESTVNIANELGYSDFFESFSVDIILKSARERGRDELERILNSRGRVYTYKDYRDNPDYGLEKRL